MAEDKIANLEQAKEMKRQKQYAKLALKAFDAMNHQDKREVLDRKAEVQIKAREQL